MLLLEHSINNGWLESKPITDSSKILSMKIPASLVQGIAKDYLEKFYHIARCNNDTYFAMMVKPATEIEILLEAQKLATRIEVVKEILKGD